MEMQMTGEDAIKLKKLPLVDSYPPEDTLPEEGIVSLLITTWQRT